MDYLRINRGNFKGAQAPSRWKALVHFQDGKRRTFYSYDFTHSEAKQPDVKLGFDRLVKMVEDNRYPEKSIGIIIVDRTVNGPAGIVAKWVSGRRIV